MDKMRLIRRPTCPSAGRLSAHAAARRGRSVGIGLTALAVCLSGCTIAPIVNWRVAGDQAPVITMSDALRYSALAQEAYRNEVADQMSKEVMLSNGLIGAGALVALLAASKVHRDAILGTAFVGGTAYTLGNSNLRRERIKAYLAGVDALICAEKAISPFDISPNELIGLNVALETLDASRLRLGTAISSSQAVRSGLPSSTDGLAGLDAALGAARQASTSADEAIKAGRGLVAAASKAPRELQLAVNKIDLAVVRAIIDATPDLTNVPKVISGLAGAVGSFAPGSGLDSFIGDSMTNARFAAKSKNVTTETNKVQDAINVLERAARETAGLTSAVAARIAGRLTMWPEDAFANCGVAQVVSAMSVSPASLSLVTGADGTYTLDISGGLTSIFVEVDGATPDGVTVKSPVRFDRQASLTVVGAKATKPQNFTLRILDSSPTAKVLRVPVSMTPAPISKSETGSGTAPKTVQKAATNKTADPSGIDSAAAALAKQGSFKSGGKSIVITSIAKSAPDSIGVTIQCPTGDATKLSTATLIDAMLTSIGVTAKPPKRAWDVAMKATGDCLAP